MDAGNRPDFPYPLFFSPPPFVLPSVGLKPLTQVTRTPSGLLSPMVYLIMKGSLRKKVEQIWLFNFIFYICFYGIQINRKRKYGSSRISENH